MAQNVEYLMQQFCLRILGTCY